MKIAVNTRLLQQDRLDGMGRFMFETLKRITIRHPEHHFYFLFDRQFSDEFIFADNITPIIVSPKARHPLLFIYWLEIAVYDVLKRLNVDLFLSPDGYLSLRSKVKQVAVIHDINFYHYPNDLPWNVRKYYNYYFPRFANKATRIATVSNYSKQDIINNYCIKESKIDVVYNGCSDGFMVIKTDKKEKVKASYAKGKNYFFYVGTLQPRKNVSRMIKAFDLFKQKTKSDMLLLVAGSKYYWTSDMQQSYNSCAFKEDIIFIGRVGEEQLHDLMGAAFALVYVPTFEGFGIPILEAMYCDVPVLTSNVTSLPEVANGACLLADPFDINDIAAKMELLFYENDLRKTLIEGGRLRRINFSWDKTAQSLWQSCVQAINTNK